MCRCSKKKQESHRSWPKRLSKRIRTQLPKIYWKVNSSNFDSPFGSGSPHSQIINYNPLDYIIKSKKYNYFIKGVNLTSFFWSIIIINKKCDSIFYSFLKYTFGWAWLVISMQFYFCFFFDRSWWDFLAFLLPSESMKSNLFFFF